MNGTTFCRAILMIGNTLRKEREKQKLSIQDIEKGTSIRSIYIEALEKGEYDKLPGEVYAKGFIKNYGNFLNLNGEELVRQFIMEISTISTPADTSATENKNTESSIAAKNLGEKYQNQPVEENLKTETNSKKYLAVAAAFLVILIGGIVYNFSGSDEKPVTVAQVEKPKIETQKVETPKVETVAEVPKTPEPAPQPAAPPPVPNPPPAVKGVNLQATFSGDCWTRVIVDGVLAYEGMFNAGETKDWKGNQSVTVLLGNAGAAQFIMNGQSVGALGGYGDVVEKTFTI